MTKGKIIQFPIRTNGPTEEIAIQEGNTMRILHCPQEQDYAGAIMPPDISPPIPSNLRFSPEFYRGFWKQSVEWVSGIAFDSLLIPAQPHQEDYTFEVLEFMEGPAPTLFYGHMPLACDVSADLPNIILSDVDFL